MNYPIVELGDICDEIYRYPSFYGMEHFSTGVPVIRGEHIDAWGSISQDWNDYWFVSEEVSSQFPRTVLREGDLVFTVRGTIGKVGLITKSHDGAQLSPNLIRFSPKREVVDTIFIWYFLQSIKETAAADIQNEVTIASVRASDLSELKIPLPSLTEQKRIASLLARADRLRQLRRTAHDLGDALLQSVFLEMFGHVRVNDKKWELARFEDVCETRLGKMLDDKKQTGKNKRPYLRNFNVRWHSLDLSDIAEMDFDEKDRKEFRLQYGDVLICEGGEVGRAAIWRNEMEECYFQKALHRARPNSKLANPEYIVHLLWWMAQTGGLVDSTSQVTFAHLTGEKLKELVIPVPPLSLQEEFAGVVARVESLRGRMGESTRQVEGLFESLLAEAFI
ncbi:MAG: restriction endonuclease subunit S [Chloroflexi bacterium]|nr:restriction endonuclease subunit S [Chloroflexota bacterium]